MPVRVTCQCGTSYEPKDEFAGRVVTCPQCGRETRAPDTPAAAKARLTPNQASDAARGLAGQEVAADHGDL